MWAEDGWEVKGTVNVCCNFAASLGRGLLHKEPRVAPVLSSHSTLQKRNSLSEKRLRRRISPQPRSDAVAVPCWGGFLAIRIVCDAKKWVVIPACQTAYLLHCAC